ncbi:hypothetical protein [Pyrococcus sp. NA2]|uniref:hypothetical protein n=1 Tax=Pyrococcus sp. (strain NA2) TaxID=342949 RepID=UPI00064E32E6|nr:hypothetical protein [Pyrococcus sp. NA2]
MKKALFFVGLLLSLFSMLYYFSTAPKTGDTFIGHLVEGRAISIENAAVLADMDCVPNEEHTMLTCTAVIDANGNILKVRYTHPIEVPCLSKGDRVDVLPLDNSTVKIVRKGPPSMKH